MSGSFQAGENEQVAESFAYDSLDRLLSSTVTRDGQLPVSKVNNYDRLGNVVYKDDPDHTYAYGSCNAGPHALCAAQGTSFTYDANGNLIASTGAKARTVEYSAFNKPTRITEGGATVDFVYGADRSRVFKRATADGRTEITWYVGLGAEGAPLYEQTAVLEAGQIVQRRHLHFIYAGGHHNGQAFAVRVQQEDEDNDPGTPNALWDGGTEYYHRDHLGSVIAITGDSGEVQDTRLLSFDAWGKRRNPDWSEGSTDPEVEPVDQYTLEGMQGNLAYTGHEAVPEVGLIHMNGRVYDPELGVFLSADPEIQAPTYSQNYNRYSYVLNNPIRYTDPSGYNFLENMSQNLSTFISVALNFVCGPWCSAGFNAVYANANGASFGDSLLMAGAGFVGGGFAQGVGGGVLGGMVSGAITGAFGSVMNGGDFWKGAREGAKRGAAAALVMRGMQWAIGALQPETTTQPEVSVDPQGANPSWTPQDDVQLADSSGNYTPSGLEGDDPKLTKREAELLGRYAGLYKEYIEGLSPSEMRGTFPELKNKPYTQDGDWEIDNAKYSMSTSLRTMQVDSLSTLITNGYAEVVNSPIEDLFLSPSKYTRYISDVFNAVDLLDAQRIVLPITPLDSNIAIGCNQYGCKAFIDR